MTNRSGLEANAEVGLNNPTQHNVDLPGDALADVAVRLVTESPAQTASDLTNFKLAGVIARDAVESSHVGPFHRRLTRLGEAARLLFDNTIPHTEQVAPPSRLKSTGAIIDYLAPQRRQRLVQQVLSLSDEQRQAEAMGLLKDKLSIFDANDRTCLIDRALSLFSSAEHSDDRIGGALLLVHGYDFLSNSHKSRILDRLRGEVTAGEIYWNVQDDYKNAQRQSSGLSSPGAARSAVDHDDELLKTEGAVRNLTAGGLVPAERLDDVERASDALAEEYRSLRHELYASVRVRENSGRS
ncbi:hypothetical protein [Rhizobium binae]|uniref:hypothetical protein n=1 Tax=Rhizobium binae TaxID=1138190 RepID=UPI001C834F85|nr:hypothetical protein [Rhizobium binae]MBX4964163.1 hypothetical protein [Rhizobium binae]